MARKGHRFTEEDRIIFDLVARHEPKANSSNVFVRGANWEREEAGLQRLSIVRCYLRTDVLIDAGYLREEPYTDINREGQPFTRHWYFTTAEGRAARRWRQADPRPWWRRLIARVGFSRSAGEAA